MTDVVEVEIDGETRRAGAMAEVQGRAALEGQDASEERVGSDVPGELAQMDHLLERDRPVAGIGCRALQELRANAHRARSSG